MIADYFSSQGALAKAIDGFVPRQPQIDMAEAVAKAIRHDAQLVVEAGTGTGKTFAYLIPALTSGKKVIISTGSKALQEQLYHRDLPLLKKALGYHYACALLKGRSNYLCLERLHREYAEAHSGVRDKLALSQLVLVRHWSSQTSSGDLADCASLPEDSPIIPTITSTNDNCLGRECPQYEECFVVKARRRAMDAQLVVVNHHLFLADLAIKETGFGELIPQGDVFIFDEAHQLPDIATQYFGTSLSSRQLMELGKDIDIAYRTELRDSKQLQKVADKIQHCAMDLRLVLGEPGQRGNWREIAQRGGVAREVERLQEALDFCQQVLKLSLGRSQLLDAAYDRSVLFQGQLARMLDTSVSGYSYWYECTQRHFVLHITPLSVAQKFQEQVKMQGGSWIFTSATLSVNHNFQYFTARLGLTPSQAFTLPSPFDYQRQAVLCVPRFLPEPNSPGLAQTLVERLSPVIEANQGRCFFLCTSHQMVRALSDGFRQHLSLPVLAQGEIPKQKLLSEFLTLGNALLIATGTFWEGVDVRGQALSCVMIDKLPFGAPDDPLLKARMEDCQLTGCDPFSQVQIPDAVIALKQGVGRLIRDQQDHGALIICDNRLVTRQYGATFVASLPEMPRTRDLNQVIAFLTAGPEAEREIAATLPENEIENNDDGKNSSH
ncbi:putative ATP-dependent DNA helicase YoaA [Vibrio stylophorae]|uniref:DNA 5'-3' helicase n=1 Tax=Vibrio stylophorae TaxID=659351 RepID=A0ABN8DQ21_9VIBR|nr:ATP-dependent DNA helicase [Vibrio stylophorae]CAH0533281.1 putative ATP-dependent DNA helicase YoaA [Vibrio stylophorae]